MSDLDRSRFQTNTSMFLDRSVRPERLTLHVSDSVRMRIVSGEEGMMAEAPEAKAASSGGPARARRLTQRFLLTHRFRTDPQSFIHLLLRWLHNLWKEKTAQIPNAKCLLQYKSSPVVTEIKASPLMSFDRKQPACTFTHNTSSF